MSSYDWPRCAAVTLSGRLCRVAGRYVVGADTGEVYLCYEHSRRRADARLLTAGEVEGLRMQRAGVPQEHVEGEGNLSAEGQPAADVVVTIQVMLDDVLLFTPEEWQLFWASLGGALKMLAHVRVRERQARADREASE